MKNSARYENMAQATQDMEILLLGIILNVLEWSYRKIGKVITSLDDAQNRVISKRQPSTCDFLTQDFSILRKQ